MIDTNVKGLLYVSQLVAQTMKENRNGHIINISSIAGKDIYQGGNVYCATKAAVESITKAMRIDLLEYNIKVSSIAPGMVNTNFSTVRFHGDEARAQKVYEGVKPLSADDVASAIEFIVTRPDHVCVNDLLLMPTQQASANHLNRTKE
jgi:NADP-dependent 3-hydroxy acid dehydrogenase YdfG